jgi:pimeloyl-ACP methyl ester carboxylesterase
MLYLLPALCLGLPAAPEPIETRFVQVAPAAVNPGQILPSTGQRRAVVLIPGLHPHPFSGASVPRAYFAAWQQPGSPMVRALARDADVFAFTYGQAVPVPLVAAQPALPDGLRRLRQAGYTDIVLVGFSAGGLVARQFVEDEPRAGVTKVVQVCAPNGGSSWAELQVGVRPSQRPFLQSLTKEARAEWLRERAGKRIPDGVQFVCVIGTGMGSGDGLVSSRSAWSEDLQRQGIPAVTLAAQHLNAVRCEEGVRLIAELVREEQPRWDALQVEALRRRLWGGTFAIAR